jgi:hypothetical protein
MKIQAVKDACRQFGWERVYANFPELYNAFQSKGYRAQPCPKTGNGDTKFRFFRNFDEDGGAYHNDVGPMPDGIEVISWYTGQGKGEVMKMLEDIVGGVKVNYQAPAAKAPCQPRPYCSEKEAKAREARIKKYYNESVPVAGTLAEIYLRSRGIKSFSNDYLCEVGNNLRFHPKMPYRESDDAPWQHFPTLLAVVRDKDGKPLTLHRTFLSHNGKGKAPVSRQKMIMAPPRDMRGGFILLDKPVALPDGGYFIGLSEGIENGLSTREGAGTPMWVGISDRLLAMTNLPSCVRACALYSDIEPSGAGQRAAKDFAERNKSVDVMNIPPKSEKAKADWNDEYQLKGHKAFYMKMKKEMRIPSINFDVWWENHYAEYN